MESGTAYFGVIVKATVVRMAKRARKNKAKSDDACEPPNANNFYTLYELVVKILVDLSFTHTNQNESKHNCVE